MIGSPVLEPEKILTLNPNARLLQAGIRVSDLDCEEQRYADDILEFVLHQYVSDVGQKYLPLLFVKIVIPVSFLY